MRTAVITVYDQVFSCLSTCCLTLHCTQLNEYSQYKNHKNHKTNNKTHPWGHVEQKLYSMLKSFMIFSMVSNALFLSVCVCFFFFVLFFLSLCAFSVSYTFFLALFLVRLYLSFLCVFSLCAIFDSVHILSAFLTIIFPFAVFMFLLSFVVIFSTFFFCHVVAVLSFLKIAFFLTIYIGKTHYVCVFVITDWLSSALFFSCFAVYTSCRMGNLYTNQYRVELQTQSFHKILFRNIF